MSRQIMPTCSFCGKEVQADATFCPFCGSNLQATSSPATIPSPQPMNVQPRPMVTAEEKMASMVKRLERVSYINAIAAAVLLVIIVVLLV